MNVLKSLIGAATLALCSVGSANAELITHYHNPFDVRITTSNPYSFTHDLTSYGLPGPTVNSATVTVDLYDLFDPLSVVYERVTLQFNNASFTRQNVSFLGGDYVFDVVGQLQNTGLLNVTISVSCTNIIFACLPQDVWFDDSLLEADITRAVVAEVPEPATLLTLGAGLLGLAGVRRLGRRRGGNAFLGAPGMA